MSLYNKVIKSGHPLGEPRVLGEVHLESSRPEAPTTPPRVDPPVFRRDRMEAMARKMAERLMADRVREVEEVAQERSEAAYRSGLEDGRSLGVQTTREEMAPVLESLRRVIQEIEAQRDGLLEAAERTLLQLSMTIARRILRAEFTVRPEAVLDIVRVCLSQVKESSKVVVRVHPEDEQILRAEEGELRAVMGQFGVWELREDAQIPRGGCLIDTDFGVLDGRLESQLEEIERTLVREHEHGRQGTESVSTGD